MTNMRLNKLLKLASAESTVDHYLLWDDKGFRAVLLGCDGLGFDESMARLMHYINENY